MARRLLLLIPPAALLVLLGEAVWALWLAGPASPFAPPPPGDQRFGPEGGPPLRLVVLGDSTTVAQGAEPEDGIAHGAAELLTRGGERRVLLRNLGVSGATWADVLAEQAEPAAALRPDVVFVSSGANDVLGGRSAAAVADDVEHVVTGLRRAVPGVTVVITGVPDLGTPPRIPQPLRWLVARRAEHVDRAVARAAERLDVARVPIAQRTGPAFRADPSLFAGDGFHPDARGYAVWREAIAPTLREATAG